MSGPSVNIKFRYCLAPTDPEQNPVLIVGQVAHLNSLSWNDVRCKLEPRVTEESWRRGLSCVTSSPGDSVELWPRAASVASLPVRCSRHSAPSRSHALAKIVRGTQRATNESIVLVCRKRDVYACAVAIARSFPLYGARTTAAPLAAAGSIPVQSSTVTVEVLLVKEDNKQDGDSEEESLMLDPVLTERTLSAEELSTIQNVADATRLAARITDTPANIMNVDQFIQEACAVAKELDIEEPTIIRGEELRDRGMGGIYGVGKAAACLPALVALSYRVPACPN